MKKSFRDAICSDCLGCQSNDRGGCDCFNRSWEDIDPDMTVMQADCGRFQPDAKCAYRVTSGDILVGIIVADTSMTVDDLVNKSKEHDIKWGINQLVLEAGTCGIERI